MAREFNQLEFLHFVRGGARGRLGGYSPRRKVKNDFFAEFWHLKYPENHIFNQFNQLIFYHVHHFSKVKKEKEYLVIIIKKKE